MRLAVHFISFLQHYLINSIIHDDVDDVGSLSNSQVKNIIMASVMFGSTEMCQM